MDGAVEHNRSDHVRWHDHVQALEGDGAADK
jgi:hypothetical protein